MKYIYFAVFAFVILHNQNLYGYEQEITTDAQLLEKTATSPIVVVKFYRPTCPWCIKEAPLYTSLANQFTDIPFLSFNIDTPPLSPQEAANIKTKYNFKTVPHFKLLQGQKSQPTTINLMPRMIERARSQSVAKPTPKAVSPMNNEILKTSLMDLQQKLQNLSEMLPTSKEESGEKD